MKLKVRITLTEEMLGTKPANKEVFASYIASKAPDDDRRKEELETAEHREEAGTTVFARDPNGAVCIYDYQIKGFLKDALNAACRCDIEERGGLEKLSAYKTKVDLCVFAFPRRILIQLPPNTSVGVCERPLRAETPMGPRVSVCRSEIVPAGSVLEFTLHIMARELVPYVQWCFEYGALRGLGQWRNGGKGAFTFEWEEVQSKPLVSMAQVLSATHALKLSEEPPPAKAKAKAKAELR